MLKLPTVTLIAITGQNVEAHEKAMEYSCNGIEFGDAKIVYDKEIKSIDDWNHVVVFTLGKHVHTNHALLIHHNGFVVNPTSWNPDWLNYDYIGSPWPLPMDDYSYRDVYGIVHRVGNSVGLRSKKLLDLPSKVNMGWQAFHGNTNEDGAICVNYRHIFEEHGCKFAPIEVAKLFGREKEIEENKDVEKPFIFHNYEGRNSGYPKF